MKHQVTIEIDDERLSGYTEDHLAALWHVAQANPAPYSDSEAGALVERIGREIIRRWLKQAGAPLWNHQGRDHYWHALTRFCIWDGEQWALKKREDADTAAPAAEDQ